jgi:hypothetical protein
MRRLHLFELEDQSWFPTVVRDLATDYLHFIETRFALHRSIAPVLAEALRRTNSDALIDLCSGGAGPIPSLLTDLDAEGISVTATLTDRYPNIPALDRVRALSQGRITYVAEPVDARTVPERLKGFRTMFNAFHHFHPADAVAILHSAAAGGQPIGIFELSRRKAWTLILLTFMTPLSVWIATPFMRPFLWRRLLWTYLLPMVPLTCWWDGIVSQLRAYTPAELEQLGRQADPLAEWHAGLVPIGRTPGTATYLLGYPASIDARSIARESAAH